MLISFSHIIVVSHFNQTKVEEAEVIDFFMYLSLSFLAEQICSDCTGRIIFYLDRLWNTSLLLHTDMHQKLTKIEIVLIEKGCSDDQCKGYIRYSCVHHVSWPLSFIRILCASWTFLQCPRKFFECLLGEKLSKVSDWKPGKICRGFRENQLHLIVGCKSYQVCEMAEKRARTDDDDDKGRNSVKWMVCVDGGDKADYFLSCLLLTYNPVRGSFWMGMQDNEERRPTNCCIRGKSVLMD